jgi:hypothetical protein
MEVEKFSAICETLEKVFAVKNQQYGNAIHATGVVGASVELLGCVARLSQLVLKSKDLGKSEKEAVLNVFVDAHNYAVIGIMMLKDDNWTGNPEWAEEIRRQLENAKRYESSGSDPF